MLGQRRPREQDSAYMGWLAAGGCCVACYVLKGTINRGVQVAHLRAASFAHAKATGMAEKPDDRWSTPLCAPHHTGDVRVTRMTQHDMAEVHGGFWEALAIDPFALCLALSDAFDVGRSPMSVIAPFVGRARLELAARG